MKNLIITSVDIGSSNISCTVAEVKEDNILEIINSISEPSEGIKLGVVKDFHKFNNCLEKVLLNVKKVFLKNIEELYVGLNNSGMRVTEAEYLIKFKKQIVVNEIHIKKIIEETKSKSALLEEEEIIDTIVNFFVVDKKSVYSNIIGWRATVIGVNVTQVIGKKKYMNGIRDVFKSLGYKIKGFKINCISVRSMILTNENKLGERILGEVGGENINIAVFTNGIVKDIFNLQLGGENITKDIATCCNYPRSEAERIKKILSSNYKTIYNDNDRDKKIKIGSCNVDKELFYLVVNARIKEILNFIKISLKNTGYFYDVSSIILFGAGMNSFEDINEHTRAIMGKKTNYLTKKLIGMQNSSLFNSLAIVKEVHNELKLVYGDNVTLYNGKKEVKKIIDEINLLTKVKKILLEIF